MRLGELFAGYGGLGMAVEEVFGATTAWFGEWEPAPSKILAHHWPHVPNYGDVTKIDWAEIEPVDIISGGSPCQDLSLAGKRRGMNEGTRSNLWESMREGIAIIRPKYVVWENVRGALSAGAVSEMEHAEGRLGAYGNPNIRALGRVLGDLADLGYDAEWRGLRAADVGAPHGRFRIFILAAHTSRNRLHRHPKQDRQQEAHRQTSERRRYPNRLDLGAERMETRRHLTPVGEASWGEYARTIHRWEAVMGRRAPAPAEPAARGDGHRLSPRFTEWMMGLPDGWVTSVPGVSRSDQLKACGNGVVPQQAKAALTDMLHSFQAKDIAA